VQGLTIEQIDAALETFRNPQVERNHWWYVHLDHLLDIRRQLVDEGREGGLRAAP